VGAHRAGRRQPHPAHPVPDPPRRALEGKAAMVTSLSALGAGFAHKIRLRVHFLGRILHFCAPRQARAAIVQYYSLRLRLPDPLFSLLFAGNLQRKVHSRCDPTRLDPTANKDRVVAGAPNCVLLVCRHPAAVAGGMRCPSLRGRWRPGGCPRGLPELPWRSACASRAQGEERSGASH
jgi:hypothetical protein